MIDLKRRISAVEAKLEALVERLEELDLGAGDGAVRTIILGAECLLELGKREVTISASRLLLPWSVDVLASGGWATLARFASETDAWTWARRWIDVRVYVDDGGERHCQGGVRDGVVCSAERALEAIRHTVAPTRRYHSPSPFIRPRGEEQDVE